jgi:hypothetical protein
MKLNPYAYKLYPEPGEIIPELVLNRINASKYVVPFLTRDGVKSQWVNQEIGVAHALGMYIIPIVEVGVESKGFVELRHHIKYNREDLDGTIFDLIRRLRQLMNPLTLDIKCTKCGIKFVSKLPSFEMVNEAISEDKIFAYKCPECQAEVQINPKTLETIS